MQGGRWTEEGPRGHPQNGMMVREAEGEHAAGEGDHPRDAQAPCEGGKAGESCSLRPGHLAVLRRERGTGAKGREGRRARARQDEARRGNASRSHGDRRREEDHREERA